MTVVLMMIVSQYQPTALSKNRPRGDPLVSGDDTAPLPQNTLVFYAAAPEQKVKVPEQNNLTCFSQAILQCLNGGAAKKPPIGDYWEVNLHTLAGNLVELTGRLGERYNTPQSAASEGCWGKPIILHQMDAPMVPGRIDCRTQKAGDQSSIRLVRHLRKPRNCARGRPRPWKAELEFGCVQ